MPIAYPLGASYGSRQELRQDPLLFSRKDSNSVGVEEGKEGDSSRDSSLDIVRSASFMEWSAVSSKDADINDFELLTEIGKGSFGVVMHASHTVTGDQYAMKILSKNSLIERNAIRYLKSEWRVLELVTHPFIVHLQYGFNEGPNYYLALEFCPGGLTANLSLDLILNSDSS